jgi:hypothetical protein
MTTETATKTTTIAELNDRFRKGDRSLGRHMASEIVNALDPYEQLALTHLVREFNDFNEGNDPYGEHDFGTVEFQGEKWLFKIDYYDTEFEYGSDDPSNPAETQRLMTILHSSEY